MFSYLFMYNKRGQESGITKQLIVFGLGAVFFVSVGYLMYQFFVVGGDVTNNAPKAVELKIQSCVLAAQGGNQFTDTFCRDFGNKPVQLVGIESWINCEYPRVMQGIVAAQNGSDFDIPTCPTENGRSLSEIAHCNDLKLTDGWDGGEVYVNGKTCNQILQAAEAADAAEAVGSAGDDSERPPLALDQAGQESGDQVASNTDSDAPLGLG